MKKITKQISLATIVGLTAGVILFALASSKAFGNDNHQPLVKIDKDGNHIHTTFDDPELSQLVDNLNNTDILGNDPDSLVTKTKTFLAQYSPTPKTNFYNLVNRFNEMNDKKIITANKESIELQYNSIDPGMNIYKMDGLSKDEIAKLDEIAIYLNTTYGFKCFNSKGEIAKNITINNNSETDEDLDALDDLLDELDNEGEKLDKIITEKKEITAEIDNQISEKDKTIEEKDQQIEALKYLNEQKKIYGMEKALKMSKEKYPKIDFDKLLK